MIDIRAIQEFPGHKNLNTMIIYTRVLKRGGRGIRGPADFFIKVPTMLSRSSKVN